MCTSSSSYQIQFMGNVFQGCTKSGILVTGLPANYKSGSQFLAGRKAQSAKSSSQLANHQQPTSQIIKSQPKPNSSQTVIHPASQNNNSQSQPISSSLTVTSQSNNSQPDIINQWSLFIKLCFNISFYYRIIYCFLHCCLLNLKTYQLITIICLLTFQEEYQSHVL